MVCSLILEVSIALSATPYHVCAALAEAPDDTYAPTILASAYYLVDDALDVLRERYVIFDNDRSLCWQSYILDTFSPV